MSASHGAERIALPEWPALAAGTGIAALLTADGEMLSLAGAEAAQQLGALGPPLLIHAPATWRRLGTPAIPAYDLLELFAFVAPAQPAVPTARGLAQALGLAVPGKGLENAAAALPALAVALLRRLAAEAHEPGNKDAAQLAMRMGRAGWVWGPLAAEALALAGAGGAAAKDNNAFRVWRRLPEWEEQAPPPPPSALPVSSVEARARLAQLVGPDAEQRQGQADYASAAAAAFEPRRAEGAPHMVLAEAGTGTGKTLGYVAPASLWAERNHAPSPATSSARSRRSSRGCSPTPPSAAAASCCARAARTTSACLTWRTPSPRR
jgi:ATP-dependent DNA helicase DinG